MPQLFGLLRPEIGPRRGGADPSEGAAPGWERGGVLVHIGVRSICAGIAALAIGTGIAALAIGVALESVGRHVTGTAKAGLRAESVPISVFETIRPKNLDHRASLVRVASLETMFVPNLQSRTRSHRRRRAATILSASVFSSTKNSLHSASALRAPTSLSQKRRKTRVTY